MRIGDIEFPGFVMNASGARGFFGEGYRLPHPGFLADWTGSTFVSKTCTFGPRKGNLPMYRDGVTSRERIPRCIIVKPLEGHVLNCVGLSNPGAESLFSALNWDERSEPFVISFMAVGETRDERMTEWYGFLRQFEDASRLFLAPAICELSISCPNVSHDARELVSEVEDMLNIARDEFQLKVIVNINLLVTPEQAVEISRHSACAAVSHSNSIPWSHLSSSFRKEAFGSEQSPLEKRGFGPGGYSGPYALQRLVAWMFQARLLRHDTAWLIAGGGIQSRRDAYAVCNVGHPILLGIKLGVVCITRPWRVQEIIVQTNRYFREMDRSKPHDKQKDPGLIYRMASRSIDYATRRTTAFIFKHLDGGT